MRHGSASQRFGRRGGSFSTNEAQPEKRDKQEGQDQYGSCGLPNLGKGVRRGLYHPLILHSPAKTPE